MPLLKERNKLLKEVVGEKEQDCRKRNVDMRTRKSKSTAAL